MVNYLKSDFLKQKKRFTFKLLWLSPLIPIALSLILMGGNYFMEGAFNWWYTLILPGSLSMIVSFTVSGEMKHNRHGLLSVCINKKMLWLSQIIMNTILLLCVNLIYLFFMIVMGAFFGLNVPFTESLTASFVLFLTFAWQIPVFMLISEKLSSFFSIIINLVCNMGFGIFFAATKLWFIPFAIPARLMCPIIKVLPNGLPLPAGHHLSDNRVILTGLVITIGLYFIFSLITTLWFNKREVK
jgi:ABC-2 type transport system permease protein